MVCGNHFERRYIEIEQQAAQGLLGVRNVIARETGHRDLVVTRVEEYGAAVLEIGVDLGGGLFGWPLPPVALPANKSAERTQCHRDRY